MFLMLQERPPGSRLHPGQLHAPWHPRHRRNFQRVGKRIIFRDSQAPLKIAHRSPVSPDLLLESWPKNKVPPHAADTLEISSLFTKKSMTFKGTLNHAPIKILIDSGAMGNFVSKQAADRFSFAISDVSNIPIVFANGATGACNKAALAAYLRFENHEEKIDLRVVSLPHHDIILGQPWLEKWNPPIYWKNHKINFTPAELKQTLQIKKLEETATLPERKTPSAAGYDLTPAENFTLSPGEQRLINTGIAMVIPEGYYGQLHPRSSTAKIELSVEGGVINSVMS